MSAKHGVTRRDVLQVAAVGGLGVALGRAQESAAKDAPPAARGPEPRNVIFMVADGMSLGVPTLAEPFSRLARGRGTHWYELLQNPRLAHGLLATASLSSMVTDSSAASSAWGSGVRVFNGAVNVLPDDTRLTPLAPLVRDTGRRLGLVTTTTITHATPAGFAASVTERGDEDDIAVQYLDLVDVLLGGGRKHFARERRHDERDLRADFAGRGYGLWDARAAVVAGDAPARVLGLFSSGHLPYTLDQRSDEKLREQVPTLAEMTKAALACLDAAGKGFVLQVEGGRVDHAAHNNDAAGMLWDQLAFDDALGVVLAYAETHADTLVVITSDHGNSNPGLNGMGPSYGDSTQCFERIAGATMSTEALLGKLAQDKSAGADAVIEVIRTATGIELKSEEAAVLCAGLNDKAPPAANRQLRGFGALLAQVLGNHHGVQWTGVSHTADLVLATALGPGAERFSGLLPHTAVYERLCGLLGIQHRNPQMAPEQARKYLARAAVRETPPHWLA